MSVHSVEKRNLEAERNARMAEAKSRIQSGVPMPEVIEAHTKHPWAFMKPGDVYPGLDHPALPYTVRAAAFAYGARSGKEFKAVTEGSGADKRVRIWRTK